MAEDLATIATSGGDYTTLAACEAGEQKDYDTANNYGLWRVDSVFADTTRVSVDGSVTSAADYIEIRVAPAVRHVGIYSTSKYRLEADGGFDAVLDLSDPYVRAVGLQIKNTAGSQPAMKVLNVADCRAEKILVYGSGGAGIHNNATSDFYELTAINCIVYGCTGDGFYAENVGEFRAYNCDLCGNGGSGCEVEAGASVLTNCYAGGNTGADYAKGLGSITFTTTYSEDGSLSTPTAAYSTSSGCYFTNITGGSEDFHIGTSSTLKDAGTDLSGTFTDDIDGDTRSGTWDIGADEYVAAGGAGILRQMLAQHE